MASISETGHAKNVANFESLISFCAGYRADYNPSNANLKIGKLHGTLKVCKGQVAKVITKNVAYNKAVITRSIAFSGIKKLSTRLVNSLDATGASPEIVKSAKAINSKIRGSKKIKTEEEVETESFDTEAPVIETPRKISTSQQSYSNIVEHLAKMVALLAAESDYKPNETELQVATLNTLLTSLKDANNDVTDAYTNISNARIKRNKVLYDPTAGLFIISKEVKMYVKSVYGARSPQYKQVRVLVFKEVKI